MKHEIAYFDAKGKVSYSEVEPENGWTSRDGNAWNETLGLGFSWKSERTEGRLKTSVPMKSLREEGSCKFKDIVIDAGGVSGADGDGGALFLPIDSGRLCHNGGKAPQETWISHFRTPNRVYWSNMSVIGSYANGRAKATIIEGGKYDAQLRVRTCWGLEKSYSVDAVFAIRDFQDDAPLDEDISIFSGDLKGDWRAIAKFYREFIAEKVPTLAKKSEKNPDLDYSARAMTVRCRMAVKPLPCEILEQTPENEPPVKVFMSFADVRKVADEFAKQKVGESEFCFVGWNHGGHDGAFPQLFPVEEAVGGEAEMRKTIEHVKKLGYHISLHDNYYDGYTLAGNFDPADICVKHDGSRCIGGGKLAGGQAYRICGTPALEKYAPENMRLTKALGLSGAYFVDVVSIIGLEKCYDKRHPLSRKGNAETYKGVMKMQHDVFGVSMSEGARDWALPELDRAYMVLNCMDIKMDCVDELVPFFQLVYHGRLIYNSFREGINCFPGEKLYLMNLAWGGLPLIYFHHLFFPQHLTARKAGAKTGWANDLTLEGPEKLAADVAKIKRMSDDVAKLAHLRFVEIEDVIARGDGLTQTIYANGQSVWANYSDAPAKSPKGSTIPSMDFIVE